MQKSNINPACLQQMLESAANAADKGQSQFFTPLPFGRALSTALPAARPTLVDLTCGAGDLLQASANTTTTLMLGADIDPCHLKPIDKALAQACVGHKITHSLLQLYPLLQEANFKADCFVLNPPWRLFWYREQLADLAQSNLPAVRDAFAAAEDPHAGGCPRDCIDSTIATLAIALDGCTVYGEGLLIANDATLQRLLFGPDAPHSALARHVWAHLTIPGNPMTGIENCQWQEEKQFNTGVLYFAREHTIGPKHFTLPDAQPATTVAHLNQVRQWRQGAELRSPYSAVDCLEPWQAVKERVGELNGRQPRVPWNLWLTAGNRIRTALSRFEEVSIKLNKKEAARLFAINGKAPMELVLQRAQRDELLHVAVKAGWRVQPELLEAVHAAVQQYHAARAPLYPLPEIQRLGYLDEHDTIECRLDLRLANLLVFQAGRSYPIRTQTIEVKRTLNKPNSLTGIDEEIQLSGQELAIFLKQSVDEEAEEFCFMDARLRDDKKTEVPNAKTQKGGRASSRAQDNTIDFTLQDLCASFVIPEVPDVATVNPKGYEAHLETLAALETLTT